PERRLGDNILRIGGPCGSKKAGGRNQQRSLFDELAARPLYTHRALLFLGQSSHFYTLLGQARHSFLLGCWIGGLTDWWMGGLNPPIRQSNNPPIQHPSRTGTDASVPL